MRVHSAINYLYIYPCFGLFCLKHDFSHVLRMCMFRQELADCMAGDKRIGGEEQRLLAGLIENKHPGVMTAYTNYATNQVWYQTVLIRC